MSIDFKLTEKRTAYKGDIWVHVCLSREKNEIIEEIKAEAMTLTLLLHSINSVF